MGCLCILVLHFMLGAAVLTKGAAGACSMDSPQIQEKYSVFAQKQLMMRAAHAARERLDMAQGERVRQMMAEAQPAPIRIKLITQLQGTYLRPDLARRLAQQLAPGAVRIIQKFVQRRPRPRLVLYVTANNTKECKAGALAYTLPCATDMVTGRPTAAAMNVCPLSQRSSPRRLLNTLVHEAVHGLGFSGQLFPLYYDSGTWNPYQKAQQIKVEFSAHNKTAAEAMFIAFPAMKELAQKHFGCSSLPGAPADVDSLASHFKQRLFGHELMMPATSADGTPKQITPFTLTLLEATGWYKTRMDLAQAPVFGKGAGSKNPWQNFYCAPKTENTDQCTFDYKGIGVCTEGLDDGCLVAGGSLLRGDTLTCLSPSTWSTLRHQAFYFHHKAFGGSVGHPAARCYALADERPACMRTPGSSERTCLMRDAMCLETRCTSKAEVEAVFRMPEGEPVVVPCPQGGYIDLAKQLPGRGFVSGRLRCPLAEIVCPELTCKRLCVHGVCTDGRCVCDMEYVGEKCDKSLIPGVL
ncbi:hypothetical protein COO60DRAFT_1516905 [Scenedesmus sp. NREL 46B-D3]|nr:hypothetical protein COO60DRAFT_1516905 [Scenedesmus sp. NREL 46B-D3]